MRKFATRTLSKKSLRHIRTTATDTRGVIDLASIMVGVIIVGILGAGITATVFAAVPWAQDQATRGGLAAVATAESSQITLNGAAMAYDNHPDSEFKLFETTDPGIVTDGRRLVIETGDDGQSWLAASRSDTGKVFLRSSLSPDVYEAEEEGYVMASAAGYSGGTMTFALPTELRMPSGFDTVLVQQMVTNASGGQIYAFASEKLGFGAGLADAGAAAPEEPVAEATSRMAFTIAATTSGVCSAYKLPVHSIGVDGVMVDWGDGSEPELVTTNFAPHAYTTAGSTPVTVDGEFAGFGSLVTRYMYQKAQSSTECTTSVTQWDDATGTKSLDSAFAFATKLTDVAEIPAGVTNMAGTFRYATTFNQPLGANFDTSSVTNMNNMFLHAYAFNQPLGDKFNTVSVTNMVEMFEGATAFNGSLGANFDTSSVTNMDNMFDSAYAFNQPLGAKFDTVNVVYMRNMFNNARAFDSSLGANFDTSSVTQMVGMFSEAHAFNQPLGAKFDTSNVTDLRYMFSEAFAFNQPLGDKFNTIKVTNMDGMFAEAKAFNSSLGANFDTSSVTRMDSMFKIARAFNQPLGAKFDTSGVTDMDFMFYYATAFDQSLGANFDTSNVTNMIYLFGHAEAFNQPLGAKFDTSGVSSIAYMFTYAKAFNQPLGALFNTTNVTDMRSTFSYASSFNQPFDASFNTINVTKMGYMFSGATAFNQNISDWNVDKVGDWYSFRAASALTDANTPLKFR